MSYIRANTGNPNGWRPGTLGALPQVRVVRRIAGRRRANLGFLDNNALMQQGANYVFYFNYKGTVCFNIDPPTLAGLLSSGDGNFGSATGFLKGNGQLAIAFTWNAPQSWNKTVIAAGAEAQNVLNGATGVADCNVIFLGADGGSTAGVVATPAAGQNTSIPAPDQPKPPGFDLSNLFSGFGVGALLALVLGIVVVKDL